MIEILSSFLNTVVSLVQFLINSLISFVDLLTKIPSFIAYVTNFIIVSPGIIQTFLLASISVYIIYLIINR